MLSIGMNSDNIILRSYRIMCLCLSDHNTDQKKGDYSVGTLIIGISPTIMTTCKRGCRIFYVGSRRRGRRDRLVAGQNLPR